MRRTWCHDVTGLDVVASNLRLEYLFVLDCLASLFACILVKVEATFYGTINHFELAARQMCWLSRWVLTNSPAVAVLLHASKRFWDCIFAFCQCFPVSCLHMAFFLVRPALPFVVVHPSGLSRAFWTATGGACPRARPASGTQRRGIVGKFRVARRRSSNTYISRNRASSISDAREFLIAHAHARSSYQMQMRQ
jgi:hypothetical protein